MRWMLTGALVGGVASWAMGLLLNVRSLSLTELHFLTAVDLFVEPAIPIIDIATWAGLRKMLGIASFGYLFQIVNVTIYAGFGYGFCWARSRGWRGYASAGLAVITVWVCTIGGAVLAGVSNGHADGIWVHVLGTKMTKAQLNDIVLGETSTQILIESFGPPDCILPAGDREVFVYRSMKQRRYVSYYYFISTGTSYGTVEWLHLFYVKNDSVVGHKMRREYYNGKRAEEIRFSCGQLAP